MSIRKIAARAGVSIATVSRRLNSPEKVEPHTAGLAQGTAIRRPRFMLRRDFMLGAAAGLSTALLSRRRTWAATVPARIEILTNQKLGRISPNIFGHFAEQLGGVIYDGVWVGENSKIPNVSGIRLDLVERLRKIKAPIIRWPGGCFADSYDWKDGVGPKNNRPRRTNFWADQAQLPKEGSAAQKYDSNEFGTNEFLRFCRAAGAEPYLAANLRSLPAQDFYRWIEYCNSPQGSTSLANMRTAAGYSQPFNVRYWGVGNESWGCGGNLTVEEYATEFRRFTAWLPRYGVELSLVASGPNSDDYSWSRRFLERVAEKGQLRSVFGLSLHHYTWNLSRGKSNDWVQAKGDALAFDVVDYYELLREASRMDDLIQGHWQSMGEIDRGHSVKLVVDEWGPWYRPGTETRPTDLLGQMITMRDAVMSAITLDTFIRHCGKVAIANCAQLINCLNSLFIAHEDRLITTPVFHVFDMYACHQGAESVAAIFDAPSVRYLRDGRPAELAGLTGSASLDGNTLSLTVVNPDAATPCETEIVLRDASWKSAAVSTLTSDIRAHNTFDNPNGVQPRTSSLSYNGRPLRYVFAPASVSSISFLLG
jgi:alpha-N-arabinofuranosidase